MSPTPTHESSTSNPAITPQEFFRRVHSVYSTAYAEAKRQQSLALLRNPTPGKYVPRHYRMDLMDDPALGRITAVLEIPGIDLDGVNVQVLNDVLVVEGDRASPIVSRVLRTSAKQPGTSDVTLSPDKFLVRDLKFGKFRREIPLPEGTKSKDIAADLTNGLLFLSWPRGPMKLQQAMASDDSHPMES
ncbi:hypothetical protein NLI96_g6996 [Meripilus lineatus]|uniref:SHSP domain-containing protein n=1 Tax=Meripilus lineatus TaxID=2056292 RepID=A0AAD5YFF2_9APHY|nr:hypothetical protein NLI96_g6996 [Physisporinus lineatus]